MSNLIPFRTDLPPVATLHIPRCKAGDRVFYRGREQVIENVILRGFDLFLKFKSGEEVHSDDVQLVVAAIPVYPRDHRYWGRDTREQREPGSGVNGGAA